MSLFPNIRPRRFNFTPRYYKPITVDEETPHKISIKRTTKYDPHSKIGSPIRLILFALLVGLIIWWVGGIREPMEKVTITTEDIATK